MKIYATDINYDFDPNGDERFATDLDQFAGTDIWIRVTYFGYGRDRDVWVRPITKSYNGNIYWEFNQIDPEKAYDSIPDFLFDSRITQKLYYNRLHITEPMELASTEDLMEICGLYNADKETQDFLDSIIGQDKWAHVSAVITLKGREYYTRLYIKVLDKRNGKYTYNYVYDGDVDNPDNQFSAYTRSRIKDLIAKKRTTMIANFGLLDHITKTTAEIEQALDKPWLKD